MYNIIENNLSKLEAERLIELYKNNINNVDNRSYINNSYNANILNIIPFLDELNIKNISYPIESIIELRINKIDNTFTDNDIYHTHNCKIAIVIFLNDTFEKGELILEGYGEIKPKIGTKVIFTGDTKHKIKTPSNDRYTLVAFLKNDTFNELKIIKNII